MVDLTKYRVLNRKQAAALIVVVVVVGALILWYGTGWVDGFSERMSELIAADPDKAAAELAKQLRIVSVLNGIFSFALALFMSWYGFRGIRTESMPPVGSWVMEGQRRIRTGPGAVMISKVMVAAGVLVALLGVASSLVLWQLADKV